MSYENEIERIKTLFSVVKQKEISEFISNLSEEVRGMLPESEIEILDRISLLPPEIADGRILKITIDIDKEKGTETGLLYCLDDIAKVKKHEHTINMETYVALNDWLRMDGKELSANICQIGQEHGIELRKGALVGTYKVAKGKTNKYYREGENEH